MIARDPIITGTPCENWHRAGQRPPRRRIFAQSFARYPRCARQRWIFTRLCTMQWSFHCTEPVWDVLDSPIRALLKNEWVSYCQSHHRSWSSERADLSGSPWHFFALVRG